MMALELVVVAVIFVVVVAVVVVVVRVVAGADLHGDNGLLKRKKTASEVMIQRLREENRMQRI